MDEILRCGQPNESSTFPSVVLFIMLNMYTVVQLFESVDEIFKCVCAIQMKDTRQCFSVVPFIVLYKGVLTFESVDEILKCDH